VFENKASGNLFLALSLHLVYDIRVDYCARVNEQQSALYSIEIDNEDRGVHAWEDVSHRAPDIFGAFSDGGLVDTRVSFLLTHALDFGRTTNSFPPYYAGTAFG
jgi:hypothetical protein